MTLGYLLHFRNISFSDCTIPSVTPVQSLLSFIADQQLPSGGFTSISTHKSLKHSYQTVFFPAVIACLLAPLNKYSTAKQITGKIISYLLQQRSENWTWNYWNRTAAQYQHMPYPDDCDDTFCALSALQLHRSHIISGEVLANTVQLLTSVELQEGGPYNTWIAYDLTGTWRDMDFAVQTNIAYFLSLHDISLPNLDGLFETACRQKKWDSKYYPQVYSILYFLSRMYKGKYSKNICAFLQSSQRADGSWGNMLNSALAFLTLRNFGAENNDALTWIREHLEDAYKPWPFCKDPTIDGKAYTAGSAALTASVCAAALKLLHISKKVTRSYNSSLVPAIISTVPPIFQKQAQEVSARYLETSAGYACTQIAHDTYKALGQPKAISEAVLSELAKAQGLGWLAYSLFDEVIDEKHVEMVPLAQCLYRYMLAIFQTYGSRGFNAEASEIYTQMDSAQQWELMHCTMPQKQLPDFQAYDVLAEKSAGYMLGPLALLYHLGFEAQSKEIIQTKRFFHNFLIAKQLGDDMHDWSEDLKAKRLNSVSAWLLDRTQNHLEELFWDQGVSVFLIIIRKHIHAAESALRLNSAITKPSHLKKHVDYLKNMCEITTRERQKAKDFLSHYKRK